MKKYRSRTGIEVKVSVSIFKKNNDTQPYFII